MAFISGVQVIFAPASALNNAGGDPYASTQNAVAVKSIRVGGKQYPYVSAQAYRSWLRNTLKAMGGEDWKVAPIFREKKVAYTDANPILYCDDDLFGYMRAPGKKVEAADSRAGMVGDTPTKDTVTRVSPFRVGTLVGLSDGVERDFGTMSRQEGDAVPFEHQFYRTSLKGLFSLDLSSSGVFSYENRTGYLNLDDERKTMAEEKDLIHEDTKKIYKLPNEERINRISTLLKAIPFMRGGAKMGIHYTDVSPSVVVMAVTKGGNNPFQFVIDGDREGNAKAVIEAFKEVGKVWKDTILSPLYIGWVKGYANENRQKLEEELKNKKEGLKSFYPNGIEYDHPKILFQKLAESLEKNKEWLKSK